ncbi:hypothetical protein RI129_002021 [Pyrocoelia pectoralis]|uniref:Anaphase-promoting complex subunit 1 n=1 Tax=Pyrocoelia pectoralis TaxID=417401 RepID=A0AAN7ZQ79_9COLE
MIAAKDPQEFIPSGRQQLSWHPGPSQLYGSQENCAGLSPEILRSEFEKVSIAENEQNEWWIIRKSPNQKYEETKKSDKQKHNKNLLCDPCNSEGVDSSWTWKSTDPQIINKRLSDVQGQGSKRRTLDNDVNEFTKLSLLQCQNVGVMEEELYVKDNVAIWSKGIASTGNCGKFDSSRITICSYSSQYPITHALWCTLYCELPTFSSKNINVPTSDSIGIPMPSVCIVDKQNLKIFSIDSEDFITTLPFTIGGLWNTAFGILLERKKKTKKSDDDVGPTIFSMTHPLDEVSPLAIVQGSIRLIEDYSLSILFTCEKPSICMMFDSHTVQHSIYVIRKLQNDEWMEISTKIGSHHTSSIHNLSNRAKNRFPTWEMKGDTSSPFSSRPASTNQFHLHSSQQSRSHSPMAAISRCQSPTVSPLLGSNPWFPKSRYNTSLRFGNSNISMVSSTSQLDAKEDYYHVNPLLCFDHIWSDNLIATDCLNIGPASKVFLSDDLVGRSYLCYLIPLRSQLSMVRMETTNSKSIVFGILTSVSAKDAVPIPHLHMMAILEHNGSIVLYSGLTMVGKLHVGGVLAQHIPSPCALRTFAQFNSPFPKRSTLLPQYGTPKSDPHFDEHLISPVLPTSTPTQADLALILDPYKLNTDSEKIQLNGLRDPVADRITLQYTDGTYYRITLPSMASFTLVENCLNALRQVLSKDCSITLLTRWYATRNAPGPDDFNLEQEWEMFISLIYELLGYDNEPYNEMPCDSPLSVAKRQRQSSMGSDADWNFLLDSKLHKSNHKAISSLLNIDEIPRKSEASTNSEVKVNITSVLFVNIRIIHYSLHLLYEDFKLNITRTQELPFLAEFLSKLSADLSLKLYVTHYWKDFPNLCPPYNPKRSTIKENHLKNVIVWPSMQEKPDCIMEYVYYLLKDLGTSPFPYIPNVNERTKTVVELCGVYIEGNKKPKSDIFLESFINNVCFKSRLDSSSTPKSKFVCSHDNIPEKIVLLMTEMGVTNRDLDTYPIGIKLLLYGALWKCREKPPVDWSPEAYNLLQRTDLAAQAELVKKSKLQANVKKHIITNGNSLPEVIPAIKQTDEADMEDGMEDIDSALLKLRFPEDHRVAETRRLLQSSKPVSIALVQRPDVSDHDFIEEQEKHLYAICARTMSLPIGRGMFTLRTATPVVTEPLPLPKLCLLGRAPPHGITVELAHIDYPQNMQHWPLFHNGVANGLRIPPDAHNIDSTWIIFNKPKNTTETNYEHAGFLMALGLNGHLTNLTIVNTYNYLIKANEMTSIGILLGLSSAMRGTANTVITKMLSVHLEALLPPTSMELDIPQNLQVAALLGVGLAYQGTAHRHITEVLISEIGRPPGPEMENSTDRESYSLAAGLALGLVTLQQGGRPSGLADLNVPDTLHYYMVGGNRRVLEGSQRDRYRVPSFQIREGSNVNLDVTAPGATLALGLMYLRSDNKILADWMAPPTTQYLLDFVRPDFLMLRILSRSLIMWNDIRPNREWIEGQVPDTIRPFCMVTPATGTSDIDYEAMNQAYCNIIAGACFAIGLKYAGSANYEAFTALLQYSHMFISLTSKSIAELAGKPTIETCLNVLLVSTAMVMAGTGNLEIIRIVRHLRRRVGISSSTVVTYGSHMAIHMALGLLFLGGGRFTLSNSPASVAALICAFYPKFPTHSCDNRYHLQAFRHLYVLAVEPRLIIPKDVGTSRICYARLKVVHLDGSFTYLKGPCIVPDLNLLSKVSIEDDRYWRVEFERGRNWEQLEKLLSSCGIIEVKQRAGCLSYVEDKFGFRTQLAKTLTQSETVPWNPPAKVITSFSSDTAMRLFCDNFLNPSSNYLSSTMESKFMKLLTKAAYECVIKDKEIILAIMMVLLRTIQDFGNTTSTSQLWQFKLATQQVLGNIMLALNQELMGLMEEYESLVKDEIANYILGKHTSEMDNEKELVSYLTFYDIPQDLHSLQNCNEITELLSYLSSRQCSTETITRILKMLGHIQ